MTKQELPLPLSATVESAGYRVARWAAARDVLHARVTKGRVAGDLGVFLTRWMPTAAPGAVGDGFGLEFDLISARAWLTSGSVALAGAPVERALLHLPALRSFWRNELRHEHFEALRASVPPAWFMDESQVPPGAVIHGLGITGWERLGTANAREWEARDGVLTRRRPAGPRITAFYGRDDKGRVVLRSIEASP